MTVRAVDLSQEQAARIAGLGYLIIIVAGIFAEVVIRSRLIVPGDAAATAAGILSSESLFRTSIAADLVMLTFDVVVAVALYVLLKPVSRTLSLLAASFRLVHTTIYGVTLLNLMFVLVLLGGAEYLAVFEPQQLHALVLLFLEGHSIGYALGLVFFGLHCLVLGYLILRSGYFPKVLGVLLIIAAAGYLTDSFAHVLLRDYEAYETIFYVIVFAPAFIAELSLCLWLLFKGANVPRNAVAMRAPTCNPATRSSPSPSRLAGRGTAPRGLIASGLTGRNRREQIRAHSAATRSPRPRSPHDLVAAGGRQRETRRLAWRSG